MNETTAAGATETSLLLWALAAVVAVLAAHVGLGWIRLAQRQPQWRQSWPALLLSAATLGTGICAAVVLALSAEALTFPLGYRGSWVFMLWVGAMVGSLPAVAWLIHRQGISALLGSGVLLAALGAGVQAGWVVAAGFRPGIIWRAEFIGVAAALMATGFVMALWVAYSGVGKEGSRRQLWRIGAAALFGLSLIAGQEILMAGAGLLGQMASIHQHDVPASVLCLVAGVAAPLVMGVMALDLEMRRRLLRHPGHDAVSTLTMPQRRKRRHRVRGL